ncbi:MAG TPA: hypothetical protein VEJ89_03635 [Myxococcaceae bacterium]|jgi:hypothetical protein|nr:hypothetical protein [Myxococcaceae bacterium]
MRHLSKLVLACALGTGCATAVPQAKIDGVQKSINGAADAVGSQSGVAADRLADAKREFDSAMQMAKSGSTDDALRVLEKSDSDAKLAQALGVEGTTRSQLQSVLDQIKTLKAQLGR